MEYYGIQKACDMTGVTNTLIKRLIREEKISLSNGKIPENVVCKIADENKKYISLREYSSSHDSNQFHGNTAKDRNNLLDTLEEQEFFGIEIYEHTELLIGNGKDILYFQRSEVPFLDSKLKAFFQEYGHSEEQKIKRLLKNTKKAGTAGYLEKYLSEAFYERPYTPSVTEFVRLMLQILLNYQTEANKGNKKAKTVLQQVFIPRYQKIINQLMKDMNMSKEDRNGMKLLMKEILNG